MKNTKTEYNTSHWLILPSRFEEFCIIHCVSKKTSPTFLAITRESIDGF